MAAGTLPGARQGPGQKLFQFYNIRTPYFATCYQGKLDHSQDISFPLIVKPEAEDESLGIDQGAVVGSVKELMEEMQELLSTTALNAYRILKLRDYGRIDMRLTDKGKVYVIEANPNP